MSLVSAAAFSAATWATCGATALSTDTFARGARLDQVTAHKLVFDVLCQSTQLASEAFIFVHNCHFPVSTVWALHRRE